MAAGDFSASALVQIKLKAEQMWTKGQYQAHLKPNSVAAQVLLANQAASITPLEVPDKDNQVSVTWLYGCDIVDQAPTESCDVTGPELSSKSKAYTLDLAREVNFKVDREKLRTGTYTREDEIALGMAQAIKALDEYWSKQVILKLKAFSGVNVSPEPGVYASGTTTVPAANYNHNLVAYLIQAEIMNRMPNSYFISNKELFIDWTNVTFDGANGEGGGNLARIKELQGKFNFDLWNFVSAGITEDMFMIAPGAVAMTTKNRYTAAPLVMEGKVNQTWYTVPSISLPGVVYDVTYELQCALGVGGKKTIYDAFNIKTLGGVFLNPEGCPVTIDVAGTPTAFNPTGVISYTKGA